jgi:hypothetical protein
MKKETILINVCWAIIVVAIVVSYEISMNKMDGHFFDCIDIAETCSENHALCLDTLQWADELLDNTTKYLEYLDMIQQHPQGFCNTHGYT